MDCGWPVSGNGAALTSDRIVDSMPSAVKSNLTRYDAKMPDDSAIMDVLFSRLCEFMCRNSFTV